MISLLVYLNDVWIAVATTSTAIFIDVGARFLFWVFANKLETPPTLLKLTSVSVSALWDVCWTPCACCIITTSIGSPIFAFCKTLIFPSVMYPSSSAFSVKLSVKESVISFSLKFSVVLPMVIEKSPSTSIRPLVVLKFSSSETLKEVSSGRMVWGPNPVVKWKYKKTPPTDKIIIENIINKTCHVFKLFVFIFKYHL